LHQVGTSSLLINYLRLMTSPVIAWILTAVGLHNDQWFPSKRTLHLC